MSANPSGRAKKYYVLNVIGIINSRLYYSTYGQYHTDWSQKKREKKKQNAHVCHTISFRQAQYAVPLREQPATGNGKCDE